jgi:hypothetical protein
MDFFTIYPLMGDRMGFKKFLFLAVMGLATFLAAGANGVIAPEKRLYQKDPQSCAKCHLIEPYVESWKNSDFLDHKHEQSGVACLECHQVTVQQEKKHLAKFNKKAYKVPLEEREYSNDLCFRCHGSYQEIIERTKDYKGKGLSRNPHESHYGEIDCNLCHKAHRASIDYCSQCHPPVANKPGWKTM